MHRPRTHFYAIPKADRMRRLTLHIYEQYVRSGQEEDEFRTSYKFLGCNVCRRAFLKLTGLDVHTILAARKDAIAKPPRLRPFEKGELPGHIVEGKETDTNSCPWVFQVVGLPSLNIMSDQMPNLMRYQVLKGHVLPITQMLNLLRYDISKAHV